MSYILEAQKKEAGNDDPAAAAAFALSQQGADRRWLPWVILTALLLNAALVLFYFLRPAFFGTTEPGLKADTQVLSETAASPAATVRPRTRSGPAAVQGTSQTPSKTVPSKTATGTRVGRVLSPEEAAQLQLIPADSISSASSAPTPSPRADRVTSAPAQSTPGKPSRIIQLAELPPADQQDFPKLEFSTHIFADDPELRAVVVNSKRLAEGESIGEMVLRAVTEDGILVDYRGYRVAVSVLEEWN